MSGGSRPRVRVITMTINKATLFGPAGATIRGEQEYRSLCVETDEWEFHCDDAGGICRGGADPHAQAGIDGARQPGGEFGAGECWNSRRWTGGDAVPTECRRADRGSTGRPDQGGVIQLERKGNTYRMSVARFGEPFVMLQASEIDLGEEVYVGLFVCSHEEDAVEQAMFRDVRIVGQ